MRKRELLSVATGKVLGSISDGTPRYEGAAESVLGGVRRYLGEDAALTEVLTNGWANQSLYFGDLILTK